jgi:hypothetical protein
VSQHQRCVIDDIADADVCRSTGTAQRANPGLFGPRPVRPVTIKVQSSKSQKSRCKRTQ